MSTTISYRATLVREIEQAMQRLNHFPRDLGDDDGGFYDGQLDAYAHVLTIVKDDDL